MAKLVLRKHAPPEMAPDVISHRWVLSREGRDRCEWLAIELAALRATRLYASLEPKALETAALTAVRQGLDVSPRIDLHENDRTGLGFVPPDELRRRMRRFFEAPFEMAVGVETAAAALKRFEAAVRALVLDSGDQTVAVVTHGTVLTLLVARYNSIEPFEFWESLALPSYVAVDRTSFKLDGPVHNFPG